MKFEEKLLFLATAACDGLHCSDCPLVYKRGDCRCEDGLIEWLYGRN